MLLSVDSKLEFLSSKISRDYVGVSKNGYECRETDPPHPYMGAPSLANARTVSTNRSPPRVRQHKFQWTPAVFALLKATPCCFLIVP